MGNFSFSNPRSNLGWLLLSFATFAVLEAGSYEEPTPLPTTRVNATGVGMGRPAGNSVLRASLAGTVGKNDSLSADSHVFTAFDKTPAAFASIDGRWRDFLAKRRSGNGPKRVSFWSFISGKPGDEIEEEHSSHVSGQLDEADFMDADILLAKVRREARSRSRAIAAADAEAQAASAAFRAQLVESIMNSSRQEPSAGADFWQVMAEATNAPIDVAPQGSTADSNSNPRPELPGDGETAPAPAGPPAFDSVSSGSGPAASSASVSSSGFSPIVEPAPVSYSFTASPARAAHVHSTSAKGQNAHHSASTTAGGVSSVTRASMAAASPSVAANVAAISAATAHPVLSTLYTTGFEASAFAPGNLIGQSGWGSEGGPGNGIVVQNSKVLGGSQAIQAIGSIPGDLDIYFQGSSGDSNIVAFQMSVYVPTGSTTDLRFVEYSSTYSFQSEFQILGNKVDLQSPATGSGGTFSLDQWHTIELDDSLLQNQVSLYVDDILVQQGTLFSSATSIGAFGFWNLGGTGSVYIDNLSVYSEVPEPTGLTLFSLGIISFSAARRPRKHAVS